MKSLDDAWTSQEDYDRENFERSVREICNSTAELLILKNQSYGNAILDPVKCFTKIDRKDRLGARIDEKISRLMRGDTTIFNEDTIDDLLGYLVLYKLMNKKDFT